MKSLPQTEVRHARPSSCRPVPAAPAGAAALGRRVGRGYFCSESQREKGYDAGELAVGVRGEGGLVDARSPDRHTWELGCGGKSTHQESQVQVSTLSCPGRPANPTIGPGAAAPETFLAFDRDLRLPSASASQVDGAVQTLLNEDTTRRPPGPCDGGGGRAASNSPTQAWLSPLGTCASSLSPLWSWATCQL